MYSSSLDFWYKKGRDVLPFGEMDCTDGKYSQGEVIPITEEDKKRDREEIREYMKNEFSVFDKSQFKMFNWNDIDGKTLKMSVYEGELGTSVIGIDESNGNMYVIYSKVIEESI